MAVRLIWDPHSLPWTDAVVELKKPSFLLFPIEGRSALRRGTPKRILARPPLCKKNLETWYTRILLTALDHSVYSIRIPLPNDPAIIAAADVLRRILCAEEMDIQLDVSAIVAPGDWEMLKELKARLESIQDDAFGEDLEPPEPPNLMDADGYPLAPTADINAPFPGMVPPSPVFCKKAAAPGSLEAWITEEEAGFSETLLSMIDAAGKKDSQVYTRANISRQHFSKIRKNKDYHPTKQTAVAFALALELDLEQTQALLGSAGYVLNRSSKFDLIILYFLEKKNYDLAQINITLMAFDQKLLGF